MKTTVNENCFSWFPFLLAYINGHTKFKESGSKFEFGN